MTFTKNTNRYMFFVAFFAQMAVSNIAAKPVKSVRLPAPVDDIVAYNSAQKRFLYKTPDQSNIKFFGINGVAFADELSLLIEQHNPADDGIYDVFYSDDLTYVALVGDERVAVYRDNSGAFEQIGMIDFLGMGVVYPTVVIVRDVVMIQSHCGIWIVPLAELHAAAAHTVRIDEARNSVDLKAALEDDGGSWYHYIDFGWDPAKNSFYALLQEFTAAQPIDPLDVYCVIRYFTRADDGTFILDPKADFKHRGESVRYVAPNHTLAMVRIHPHYIDPLDFDPAPAFATERLEGCIIVHEENVRLDVRFDRMAGRYPLRAARTLKINVPHVRQVFYTQDNTLVIQRDGQDAADLVFLPSFDSKAKTITLSFEDGRYQAVKN